MSKKNSKTKVKANVKSKAKAAPAKKAKAPAKKVAKKAPVKKAPAKKAPAKKAVVKKVVAKPKAKAPAKKVVAKKPIKKAVVKKVEKVVAKPTAKVVAKPVTKVVAAKPVAKAPVKVITKAETKAPAKEITPVTSTFGHGKPEMRKPSRRRRPPAKPPVPKQDLPPRNEIPAPPKSRPVIGRPAPFNRRPEPSLSRPKVQEDSNKTRYSDAELEEFRAIIIKKLEDARKELLILQAQMTAANEHGTDDTASTFKILEDGSDSLAKEEAGQLAGRQKKFMEQLENALVRIENKTYGICRVSGKLIPKERLRAVPHTTQTIEAKLNQYRD